jgi:hypothetical protein
LRERFKARCFERASEARAKAVRGKRWSESDGSSDAFDEAMDCENEDEGDDVVMQDEVSLPTHNGERESEEPAPVSALIHP